MGNRRKLVLMILLSVLTLLVLMYIQTRPHSITVVKAGSRIQISHIGGDQSNDNALNDRHGLNLNDATNERFAMTTFVADVPEREKSNNDALIADSGDKLVEIVGRNVTKDDRTTEPNVVGKPTRSQHTSRDEYDIRARDDNAVPSLDNNTYHVSKPGILLDEVVKDSNDFEKQVDMIGTRHHDVITTVDGALNVNIAGGQINPDQNLHQDTPDKEEDGGQQGNDLHVLDVGEMDNGQQTEDHFRKQASREFLDPDVNNDHIAREIVDLDEYKERRENQQNRRTYDWTVHIPRSRGFAEPARTALYNKIEEDSVTETVPTAPPAPKWLNSITEGEFKTLVNEFGNDDLRFGDDFPGWFSRTDIIRMEKLSTNDVIDAFEKEHHPRLRLLIFNNTGSDPIQVFDACTDQCAVQKSIEDWYEIVAFHLDRVLGLNRSLPTVARIITAKPGSILSADKRFSDGLPRPVIWWDPDIQHGGEFMFDQNSLDLSWTDYQRELRYKCNSQTKTLRDYHCRTKIKNIEWSKLAMFDFLLQIHDRLDRNCCGYDDDEGERCMVNGMHDECDDVDKQYLVHIMAHRYDATRLVFIDNAGHMKRSKDHLNFRLLKGIQEFPDNSIHILRSGKFREMMKRSLTIDRWFWIAVGGEEGVGTIIDNLEERVKALLDYIDSDENIQIVPDY
ncbi:uncharacterized protein LOC100370428 [Saccoglossus kowalevskii]|uniref:Uncharacterized protein LOC100370428 n=1 Tax=Saccoglossus kowalevskii TaxID=10224 RepID=A0ABM0GWN3_SACKO|nr:PREDICTED: uncharacterized protein LOC100370428 [Saccoglossus kowalevskii]